MKKLRICMISSEFPPHCAGIGNAAYNLAKGLTEKGNTVTIITRGSWRGNKTRSYKNIKVYKLPYLPFFPPFHILYHGFFVNKLLKKLRNKLDIIHLHSPLIPIIDVDLPKITTVHSTWHGEAITFKKIIDWYSLAVKLFKNSFIEYEKKLFSKTDKFIPISEGIAKELNQNYKIEPKDIKVIKNSIDIQKHKSTIISSNKEFNIVSISRLVYRKGILDLIDAAQIVCDKYPQTVFTLIGKGPLENKIRKKIKEYDLKNNFKLIGEVANNQIKKYIQASSVVVIPSYYEGLPLVLLETIASGKPVIGTSINGIKDIINDGKDGLLVPIKNPQLIAKAIIRLIENKALRIYLGENARKSSIKFDRNKMINNVLTQYKILLSKNSI